MAADKRWRLVCYDIRDPARWRNVYRIVRGAGTRVQYSIFRCRLDDRELANLRWRLAQVMDLADALLVVDLCPRCADNVISHNHIEGWTDPPATFRVISSTPAANTKPRDRPKRKRTTKAGLSSSDTHVQPTLDKPDRPEQPPEVHCGLARTE